MHACMPRSHLCMVVVVLWVFVPLAVYIITVQNGDDLQVACRRSADLQCAVQAAGACMNERARSSTNQGPSFSYMLLLPVDVIVPSRPLSQSCCFSSTT